MVISDKRIRELALNNNMINPFIEDNLQSESYDVTIGNIVTVMKKEIYCLDIARQSDIDYIYKDVEINEDGFLIDPKQYVCITLGENISLPQEITAHLRPKTSFTRLGLLVSGQHINSTYVGKLKVGLFNATDYPIRIHKGYPLAQVVFEELDECPSENKQYKNKKNAHYHNEDEKFIGAKFDKELLKSVWDKILE